MSLHFPAFETGKVLVIGDLMLDRYWHGATSRISPEAPVPVVHVHDKEDRLGGAGNVALNIAALGGQAILIGMTGDDEHADLIQQQLDIAGIQAYLSRVNTHPTVTKLRVMSRNQQLIRLDFEQGFHQCDDKDFLKQINKHMNECQAVVLSDYGKGTLKNSQAIIHIAQQHGKPVLVDPKGNDFSIYAQASLITPNLSEFEAVVGHCADEKEIESKGAELILQQQLQALVVTRGEHGMSLLRAGKPALHLPTQAQEVYDVTGAGDTVISTLALCLACGEPMSSALAIANLAAGIVVGKSGTATVKTAELRRALSETTQHNRGILTQEELLIYVQDARAHGESIVMTNGCFDIIHAGHISYLEQAARLGKRLIVAVNTDASVQKLKGPKRPINTLDQRMTVLAGLACVDWVVGFNEDTPEQLICAVKPDVLVKGGDYQPQQIAGYDCVKQNNGEVAVLDFVPDCSTSNMIKKILDSETV